MLRDIGKQCKLIAATEDIGVACALWRQTEKAVSDIIKTMPLLEHEARISRRNDAYFRLFMKELATLADL